MLIARGAVLFPILEVVYDALTFEMPRERLPAAGPLVGSQLARTRPVIVISAVRAGGRFRFRLPRLPRRCKQGQLVRRELLAATVPFGVEQLTQQSLDFMAFAKLAIQLRH